MQLTKNKFKNILKFCSENFEELDKILKEFKVQVETDCKYQEFIKNFEGFEGFKIFNEQVGRLASLYLTDNGGAELNFTDKNGVTYIIRVNALSKQQFTETLKAIDGGFTEVVTISVWQGTKSTFYIVFLRKDVNDNLLLQLTINDNINEMNTKKILSKTLTKKQVQEIFIQTKQQQNTPKLL